MVVVLPLPTSLQPVCMSFGCCQWSLRYLGCTLLPRYPWCWCWHRSTEKTKRHKWEWEMEREGQERNFIRYRDYFRTFLDCFCKCTTAKCYPGCQTVSRVNTGQIQCQSLSYTPPEGILQAEVSAGGLVVAAISSAASVHNVQIYRRKYQSLCLGNTWIAY